MSKLAVVRIKGTADIREDVKDTLKLLHLTRPNYCKVSDDNDSIRGMLEKIKETVTWGEINPETLEKLLLKRGEIKGGDPVTDEVVQDETSYETAGEFAEAVCNGEARLEEINGLKDVFRLHAPKKGYESTRRSVGHGGALGDRGEKINELILRMI